MKLNETLTMNQLTNREGIFSLIQSKSVFEWLAQTDALSLDYTYYIQHSGSKEVTSVLEKIVLADTPFLTYNDLVDIIIMKYQDKWNKVYSAFIDSTYNPLVNYKETKVETPNLLEVETPNITENQDNTRSITNVTKESTSITETNNESGDNSRYGYNSVNPVPTDNTENVTTNTTIGNLNDNQVMEDNNITDTQVFVRNGTINKSKSGTNQTTKEGMRDVSNAKLIEEELQLRRKIFFDMLMEDVDNLICLSVYNQN